MPSRTATLANALVTALAAWDQLPAGVTVERTRSVTVLVEEITDAVPAKIAVIVSKIDDESNRAGIEDIVEVGIVVIAKLSSEANSAADTWDHLTEKLSDHLRTSTTFKNISLGSSIGAQRTSIKTVVVCDADELDELGVFVSVLTGTWRISVGNRS